MLPLECGTCDGRGCERHAGRYMGVTWPTCPLRAVADDWRLSVALSLVSALQVAPLAGWPGEYVAWVQPLVSQTQRAVQERARQEAESHG